MSSELFFIALLSITFLLLIFILTDELGQAILEHEHLCLCVYE